MLIKILLSHFHYQTLFYKYNTKTFIFIIRKSHGAHCDENISVHININGCKTLILYRTMLRYISYYSHTMEYNDDNRS